MFVQIYVYHKINAAIIKERKAVNVFMVKNVSLEGEVHMRKSNIDIY